MTSVTAMVRASNAAATALDTRETRFYADSVECCPIEGFQDLFVCGNYQLLEETKKKVGCLYLMRSSVTDKGGKMEQLSCADSAAILDLKWSMRAVGGRALLGQACSDGRLQVYQLRESDNSESFVVVQCVDRFSPQRRRSSLLSSALRFPRPLRALFACLWTGTTASLPRETELLSSVPALTFCVSCQFGSLHCSQPGTNEGLYNCALSIALAAGERTGVHLATHGIETRHAG